MCRMPGSLQKASMAFPIELSHLTGRLCLTTVDTDEALEAVEDLLTCGSNSLMVSESPCLD
jgi:type II secretory ATPase GspE/PulE/Tfp pilus assembly ATPase PilB-like protein